MMFRHLNLLYVALAALAFKSTSAQGEFGTELKPVAQVDVPVSIDSISSSPGMRRFFATHGRHARAYDSNLKGGRVYDLPVKAPCDKKGCRKDQKYRCVLHQTIFGLDRFSNHTQRYGREEREEREERHVHFNREEREYLDARRSSQAGRELDREEDEERHDHISGRFKEQYAVGCVSEGQQWATIVGHNLEERICHTESSSSAGRSKMITASDQFAGHFYYAKPSTREVCAIKNYASCRKTGLCEPHICTKLHSEVTCMEVIGSGGRRDFSLDGEPHLAVGLSNGQVAFLRDMRLINMYVPDCSCVDCTPVPIDISFSPYNGLTYILYERCQRRNFINAISYLLGDPLSTTFIPPVTVSSTRAPGVHHIAAAPKSEFLFMTSHSGGNKHYLIMARFSEVFNAQLAAGLPLNAGNGKLSMWTYALLPGCPTDLIVDETNAAYVASDRTIVRTDSFFNLVSAKFYANIQVNCRDFYIQFGTGNHLITKYKLQPLGPPCKVDEDCSNGLVCNVITGRCVDPSSDCSVTGQCPPGGVCDPMTGSCVDNMCLNQPIPCQFPLVCDPLTGQCVSVPSVCDIIVCPPGAICNPATGTCVDNMCVNGPAACNAIQICDPLTGTCVSNSCANGGVCPIGYSCNPAIGLCVVMPPPSCAGVTCPVGQTCNLSTGVCAVTPP